MNQREWLASKDPRAMLIHLGKHTDARKWRLFAVACCRRFWALVARDEVSRQAVEVAERFADGRAMEKECHLARVSVGVFWGPNADRILSRVRGLARTAVESKPGDAALYTNHSAALLAGHLALADAHENGKSTAEARAAERVAIHDEHLRQVASIREIFGNPFCPVAVERSWLTSDVVLLARGIYAERAFDRMPILADALQDAGCDNDDVLNHLRHDKNHVRGCWALDLVLG